MTLPGMLRLRQSFSSPTLSDVAQEVRQAMAPLNLGARTNILGRKGWPTPIQDREFPRITRVYVRDLTAASHGNAIGIGLADFAHSRLIDKIDYPSMYLNALTSGTPFGAAIPIHFDTDRRALDSALQTLGLVTPGQERVVRIRNTLELEEMSVSEAYREEISERPDLEILEETGALRFDRKGDLL